MSKGASGAAKCVPLTLSYNCYSIINLLFTKLLFFQNTKAFTPPEKITLAIFAKIFRNYRGYQCTSTRSLFCLLSFFIRASKLSISYRLVYTILSPISVMSLLLMYQNYNITDRMHIKYFLFPSLKEAAINDVPVNILQKIKTSVSF